MWIIIPFLILVFYGVPIAIALAAGSLIYIVFSGEMSMLVGFPQRLLMGVNNFTLLCIPFFILVGEMMNRGGITKRLTDCTRALIGHLRGGLAYVNIVVSAFLSSITGMANAVAAITSVSIVPEMIKDGYDNDYSAAVSSAAAIMGPIIPPSLVLILYAVNASVSVSDLFLAGIVPGILLAAFFMAVAYIYARKLPGLLIKERTPVIDIFKSFIAAFPALSIPLIIVGGIIFGFFTATEAGAIGVLIAFIIGKFIYKEIDWKDIPGILFSAGRLTASVLFIVSGAALFGWVMAMEMIPQTIGRALLSITSVPWQLLLIVNILMFIAGLFLEPIANVLLLTPVLLPIFTQLGIHPVQAGIIMGLNLTIGLITPPVGVTMYIVSGITKVPVLRLSRKMVPYLLAAIGVLLLVTFVPFITTFFLVS